MSGGHFDYAQYRISDIAFEVKELIETNKYEYSIETLDKFKIALKLLMRAQVAAQRIDWLVSGDDGEDTFHERWDDDMNEVEEIIRVVESRK